MDVGILNHRLLKFFRDVSSPRLFTQNANLSQGLERGFSHRWTETYSEETLGFMTVAEGKDRSCSEVISPLESPRRISILWF